MSLFDLLLRDLSTLRVGESGRVVVAAGDVFLSLASQPLELTGADVVGVALRGSLNDGARHGVYVAGRGGRVAAFLQKPSEAESRRARAVGRDGSLLVDSGVVSLSARAVGSLVKAARVGGRRSLLAGVLAGQGGVLDFYEHLLIGVFSRGTAGAYADRFAERGTEAHARLSPFKEALGAFSGRVVTAEKSRFLHIGTTRELLARLGPGFAEGKRGQGRVVFNSVVPEGSIVRGRVVIEGSVLARAAKLGGENVVVGVPAEFDGRLVLPRGIGVVFLPVSVRDWAVVVFGDGDDFKSTLGATGKGTFLNRTVANASLADASLWEAPIWSVGPLRRAAADSLAMVQRGGVTGVGGERWSLQRVMGRVNHRRLQAVRLEAERLGRIGSLGERLKVCEWLPAATVVEDVRSTREATGALRQLRDLSGGASHAIASRALYLESRLLAEHGSPKAAGAAIDRAFVRVRASVDHGVEPVAFPGGAAILADQVVWAACPARLDLAGGWTDTPPICSELGGAVVNAAVTLNGEYPLQAVCRLTGPDEPTIRVSSIDLGRSVTYRRAEELLRGGDPSEWDVLAKAALVLTGFVPRRRGVTLQRHLEQFGSGLDVMLSSALPKGSGLGSSSILGATLIAALLRVLDGRAQPAQRIIELTSQLEQLMSTGGGWQDQAGGVLPGVKLLTTQPGSQQAVKAATVPGCGVLGTDEARARCVLYFTGQRRLAKNILRNVVGGYLGREPKVRGIIDRLKAGAARMDGALRESSPRAIDEVAASLSEYWSLKKQLDPGATNAGIERMFGSVERHLSGASILGAGGGGFALLIARDERAARAVRRKLEAERASPLARFFEFEVNERGLGVAVV